METAQRWKSKHGYGPNPYCEVCHGVGWLHPRDPVTGMTCYDNVIHCPGKGCVEESRKGFIKTPDSLREKGLGRKFPSFDTFKQMKGNKEAFHAFKALAKGESDKPFLFCYGVVGNGKTFLCEALVTEMNGRDIDARIFTVANLVSQLKESIGDNTTEVKVRAMVSIPALVLDDFGVEYGTEWELSKIEQIIDERYRERRITVMTSNRDYAELEKKSERILSRFSDPDISVLVCNSSPDYRRR
ncbi:MAG: DnaA/Hda family protein [Dehalococcoidales bacterium]|nr:DnaA/Hda family protein [Dehalococcoidales bacterium]